MSGEVTNGNINHYIRFYFWKIFSLISAWLLQIFRNCGEANSRNQEFQFWRQDNQPKECFSIPFTVQKINYIHQNPVMAGLVRCAEDYRLSSAIDYAEGRQCGLLEVDLLLSNLKGYQVGY